LTESVQKVIAQLRRGNRGSRRAIQPQVLRRLSAISAPCTSVGRVQKRRGPREGGGFPSPIFYLATHGLTLEAYLGNVLFILGYPDQALVRSNAAIAVTRELARPQILATSYGWFTEGFDAPDLKDAKALLDELA
jgi:hypothetical protein